jgi:hypothetical protein
MNAKSAKGASVAGSTTANNRSANPFLSALPSDERPNDKYDPHQEQKHGFPYV